MRALPWFLLAAVAGCSHGKHPATVPAPDQLLARGRRLFHRGDFGHALLAYRQLQFELQPNDPALPEVQYYLAESEFQSGQLPEAAHDFRQAADQYPSSPYAPLALLRAGDANLRMWRNPELDPSHGQEALAIYQDLSGRFPESDAAARAQLHVHELRDWFARKSYKNGLFYYKRGAYDSAIIYFKDVVANYPETSSAAEALVRLADTYRAISYHEELQETCAHLRRFYPQADGLDKACPEPAPGAATP